LSTPVVVLGMHRSGTSALARAIGLMGASLGPSDGLDLNWEQVDLALLNDDLLRILGSEWDTPAVFPPSWTRIGRVQRLEPAAKRLVSRFTAEPAWVLKDPRMCLTLPFWREQVGVSPVVVFIYRNPLEVAASLHRRSPEKRLTESRVLALWERYNCDGLNNARGLRTIVVSYRGLLASPVETCQRILDAFAGWGIEGLRSATEGASELDAARRHHIADDGSEPSADGGGSGCTLSSEQLRLSALLEGLERGQVSFGADVAPSSSEASNDVLETWRQSRRLLRAVRELKGSARELVRLIPRVTVRGIRRPSR
jgi:hypothetical protein